MCFVPLPLWAVCFEALVLSVLHSKRLSSETRREVERAISQRARQVMPFVVLGCLCRAV